MNQKIFKYKDTLTKQKAVLYTIKYHVEGITITKLAKEAKVDYRTARKWAEYLRFKGLVGKRVIGYYKIYYFKGYGKRYHLSKLLEANYDR